MVDAAEKRRSESTYSSALAKSSAKGITFIGGIVHLDLDELRWMDLSLEARQRTCMSSHFVGLFRDASPEIFLGVKFLARLEERPLWDLLFRTFCSTRKLLQLQ